MAVKNFKMTLKNHAGIEIKSPDNIPMTLEYVAEIALQSNIPNEEANDKWGKWQILKKIATNPEAVDLNSEEVTIVKVAIGKIYGPIVYGAAREYLDN